jgi:hypothetical protein
MLNLDCRQEGATGDGHRPGSNPRLSLVRLSSQPRLLRFLPAKSSNGLADGRADPLRGLLNHLPNNTYNLCKVLRGKIAFSVVFRYIYPSQILYLILEVRLNVVISFKIFLKYYLAISPVKIEPPVLYI